MQYATARKSSRQPKPSRKKRQSPIHPGEILREEFMVPLGLSINALARALRVPPNHVSGIVNEKRGISAQMALRLSRYRGTTNEFWLRLQMSFELETAKDQYEAKLMQEVLPRAS